VNEKRKGVAISRRPSAKFAQLSQAI
jgi:hypothetical protein